MSKIKGVKGFDKDLKCRGGYQYKENTDFEEKGEISCCDNGLHFCENPMDVFNYYPPSDSRYCEVEGSGQVDRDSNDSKIAVSKLHVGVEIGLSGLIKAGVKFIFDKVNWENDKKSNSAATNTGDQSAATNTGYQSAATNTGDRSAATNTGDQSAASVEGKESIAIATGVKSKARGSLGCWIVVAEWFKDEEYNWHIKEVKTAKIDGENIKADTYYRLEDGNFVEAEDDD